MYFTVTEHRVTHKQIKELVYTPRLGNSTVLLYIHLQCSSGPSYTTFSDIAFSCEYYGVQSSVATTSLGTFRTYWEEASGPPEAMDCFGLYVVGGQKESLTVISQILL